MRVYVYALAGWPIAALRATGAGARRLRVCGRRLQLIEAAGIDAAVGRFTAPPVASEAALRAHHGVVVELARRFEAVLPVRFGTILPIDELERVLTLRQGRLRRALEAVRGREQMTVRILGQASPPRSAQAATGTAYLAKRRHALGRVLPAAGKRVQRVVQPVVAAERLDPPHGRVRATLHHLIPRGGAAEYKLLVTQAASNARSGDQIVVSGPWPPFAFAPALWP